MKTEIINEIKALEFIIETNGQFPYAWAKNIKVFDIKRCKKELKRLKKLEGEDD